MKETNSVPVVIDFGIFKRKSPSVFVIVLILVPSTVSVAKIKGLLFLASTTSPLYCLKSSDF